MMLVRKKTPRSGGPGCDEVSSIFRFFLFELPKKTWFTFGNERWGHDPLTTVVKPASVATIVPPAANVLHPEAVVQEEHRPRHSSQDWKFLKTDKTRSHWNSIGNEKGKASRNMSMMKILYFFSMQSWDFKVELYDELNDENTTRGGKRFFFFVYLYHFVLYLNSVSGLVDSSHPESDVRSGFSSSSVIMWVRLIFFSFFVQLLRPGTALCTLSKYNEGKDYKSFTFFFSIKFFMKSSPKIVELEN